MFKDIMKNYRKIKKTTNKVKKIVKTVDKITGNNKTSTKRGNPSVPFFDRNKQHTMNDIDVMTGVEFELFCGELFKKQGYKVLTTKTSGDYGADLLLEKNNKKTVIQVKRSQSNIGVSAVQEVVSAVAVYNASEAWVITNAYFTPAAKTLADANNVRLLNRDYILRNL